jgi:hypothetical protein
MTPEERAKLLKQISFSIGMSGSVNPEKMAAAVLSEMEKEYEIRAKEAGNG